jgi:hypothetical protein
MRNKFMIAGFSSVCRSDTSAGTVCSGGSIAKTGYPAGIGQTPGWNRGFRGFADASDFRWLEWQGGSALQG